MWSSPSIESEVDLFSGRPSTLVDLSKKPNGNIPRSPFSPPPREHRRRGLAHVAAIVLLVSVVMTVTLCRSPRTPVEREGLVTRKLASGDGDQSEEESISHEEACQDMKTFLEFFDAGGSQDNPSPPPSANVPGEEQPRKRKRKTDRPAGSDGETEEQSKTRTTHSPKAISNPSSGSSAEQGQESDWEDDVVHGSLGVPGDLDPLLFDPDEFLQTFDSLAPELPHPSSESAEAAAPITDGNDLALLLPPSPSPSENVPRKHKRKTDRPADSDDEASADVPQEERPRKRKKKTDRPVDSDGETEQQSRTSRSHSPKALSDPFSGSSAEQGQEWDWEAVRNMDALLFDPDEFLLILDSLAPELPHSSSKLPEAAAPIRRGKNMALLLEAAKKLQGSQPSSASSSPSGSDFGGFSPSQPLPLPTQQLQEHSPSQAPSQESPSTSIPGLSVSAPADSSQIPGLLLGQATPATSSPSTSAHGLPAPSTSTAQLSLIPEVPYVQPTMLIGAPASQLHGQQIMYWQPTASREAAGQLALPHPGTLEIPEVFGVPEPSPSTTSPPVHQVAGFYQSPGDGGTQPQTAMAAQAPSSTSGIQPSRAGTAQASTLRQTIYSQHLFYRRPLIEPGARVPEFFPDLDDTHHESFCVLLGGFRELLTKPLLTEADATRLMDLSQRLMGYASRYLSWPALANADYVLLANMASRFLVLDVLWATSEAVGPAMNRPLWWDWLTERLVHVPARWVRREGVQSRDTVRQDLARELLRVLEGYKRGEPPSPEETVKLKQQIFCKQWSPPKFKKKMWDPWREDDKDSADSA